MDLPSLSVISDSLPTQHEYGDEPFPLVLQCQDAEVSLAAVEHWISESRDDLIQRVERQGAILFRGFPLRFAADFERFVAAFDLPNFPYDQSLSNAVRINYSERVFSANEAPADVTIFLHHEMAQTPIFPSKLFFFCEQPAATGGATPLCRSDILWNELRKRYPEFARACETRGLRYSNVMPGQNDPASGMGRSWQSTLRAETREAAERRLEDLGYTWQWLPDGCLRATTPVLPAVREVLPGCRTFFNQLIAAFRGWKDSRNDPGKALTFGDGTPLDRETVMAVAEIAETLTFDLPWQRGDVALVDNFLVMHGRRTFQGTRKVLASLVASEQSIHALE